MLGHPWKPRGSKYLHLKELTISCTCTYMLLLSYVIGFRECTIANMSCAARTLNNQLYRCKKISLALYIYFIWDMKTCLERYFVVCLESRFALLKNSLPLCETTLELGCFFRLVFWLVIISQLATRLIYLIFCKHLMCFC